ncbi:MAG TPA: PKD domain-containing protein [Puia sp.]
MTRKLLLSIGCLCWLGIIGAIAQTPVPDFSATPTSGCGPLSVTFKDLTTNNPTFWQWDFGNGQTSTQQNPNVVYNAPGTYTVELLVRNASGTNAIKKTDYITVFPFPTPAFTSNLTVACAPANIQYTDKSTPGQGSIVSWNWTLGDGTNSTQQNPSHTYTQTGYYTVLLQVTNSQGCSNTANAGRYLRVVPGIQPDFAYDQVSTSCAAPFIVNFVNQTAGPGILSYAWNLGTGATPATSTAASPSGITYPGGNYTVALTVTSDLGCSANVQKPVSFAGGAAVITSPDTACVNSAITFTNGSSPTPLSSTWDFGDGTGSTVQNPSTTYTAVAPYTVKLVNTYASCKDSATKLIQVINNPIPAFTADHTASCKAPFTVQFTDKTTAPMPAKWLWDFGDGNTSNLQNPSHTYTTPGVYDVRLTVTNSAGCSNTDTMTKYIQIVAPTVTIDAIQGCINTSISATATINAPDGIASYAWTATGATPPTSTLPNPNFIYTTPGNYPISLIVTTNTGCTTPPANGTVQVGAHAATPDFTISPNPVCGNNTVTFQSTSTPADHWDWFFGDGAFSGDLLDNASHAYSDIGPYSVILNTYSNGCVTQKIKMVNVTGAIVGFTHKSVCPNAFQIQFTDTSHIDPAQITATPAPTYLWDFGDAVNNPGTNTSTLPSPTHDYNSTGVNPVTYNVTLTITTSTCTNTVTIPITLGPTAAAFTAPPTACRNTDFHLTSTSTNSSLITLYWWQIDGKPGSAPSPSTSGPFAIGNIAVLGTHTLSLTIFDSNGCVSTVSQPITIIGPLAKFTAPAGGCKNSPITFTDQTTPYPGSAGPPAAPAAPITSWNWDFGDGTITNLTAPYTHPYADTGAYTVKLTVTDNAGCIDTTSAAIQITAPQAFFSGPDSFYCPGVPLTFKDSSQGYGLVETWDFGDGPPTFSTPTHTYSAGNYTVSLSVKDQVGCVNSTTHPLQIKQPIAAFTIADTTAICAPLQTMFTAQGQFYDSLYWDFGDLTTSTLPNTSHFYNDYGTYTATLFVQGPGGCQASASRQVFVANPFTAGYSGTPLQACDSLLVSFQITPPIYAHFDFVFGDGAVDTTGDTAPSHLYRRPSTYTTQLVMNDPSGCIVGIGSNTGTVTILGAVPFFSMDQRAFCDSGTVNFTDFTIPITDVIASETYAFGDGQTASQASPNFNAAHLYDQTGTLLPTLTVVTGQGCTESYTDTVRIHQTPHPLISTTSLLCTGLIQFQGNLATPDADTVSWAWNFGNGQSSKQQDAAVNYAAGTYTVSLKTSVPFGCSDTTSKTLTINPLPTIKGPAEITTPVGIPVTLPFTYSSNVVAWSWTPTTYLDCPTCPNPAAGPTFDQQYKVAVLDNNNCADTATILVKTICNGLNYWLPNTFSPNGDGVNDVFYPRGDNLYNIQSMRIFNRWGQLVFERKNFPANSSSDGWDGTFNGRPSPSDAYVYIVEVICNNAQVVALRGDITLVR